jgi:hypothetical protein
MADPIRLPYNRPKRLHTTKVSRTARQKFQNRRERQNQRNDAVVPGRSDKESKGRIVPDGFSRTSLGMSIRKSGTRRGSRGKRDEHIDPALGKVIDICI